MDLQQFLTLWHDDGPTLTVHTSGSTGTPKDIVVEKSRMMASARTTCRFLGLHAGHTALLCLPLNYIAGQMMVVRALTCGLQLTAIEPDGHPMATDHGHIDFAAMVPLQVWNSLQTPAERNRLMQIGHLIIGGGAIDEALENELRTFPNAVWSTYGMTETLSNIALRRISGPEASLWYTPYPTVAISLNAEGCLVVSAPEVCPEVLTTNDLALLRNGRFRILGRRDNVVSSGGVKIQMEEVERMLAPHIHVPFCATRRKDERLGEALTLLVATSGDTAPLRTLCQQVLPRLWVPRHIVAVSHIPTTATGKTARHEAELMAQAATIM